ncbi:adaptor protein, putative [Theileria annulata]|uniref:Adaptor protein, putative n=1 Tax=Theileria annulata TaxID=5874 RepID=Q4UHJ2_THEAN|nr:adaptor protein, putative [Theileria annulata]CAI73447.1 adaptor protein, putative [Theileria annulata]|eukprot:XP_954124.1 adaptor protein, putative [Theileria annulata]
MISCIFIATSTGKVLLIRLYRGDVTKEDALIFCRNVLSNSRNTYAPMYRYEKFNFFRVNVEGINLVALTRLNGNSFLILHTLKELKKLLLSFLSGVVTEENIVENSFLLYELFDEVIDGGYTQNLEPLVLMDVMATKAAIKGSMIDPIKYANYWLGFLPRFGVSSETFLFEHLLPFEGRLNDSDECLEYCQQVVSLMATSVIPPWRKLNTVSGRNSITVELTENLSVLYNYNSELISYEVTGSIVVNSMLIGTPLVHLRMNDDFSHNLSNNLNSSSSYQTNKGSSQFHLPVAAKQTVRLDDYKFHQCVNLESIKSNKTITFVPPEGMFVLLCYRSTTSATIPFILRPKVKLIDTLHINYSISLSPTFSKAIIAQKVCVKIPIPRTTKEIVSGTISTGTTMDVNLSQHFVTWNFRKLQGETTFLLTFTASLTTDRFSNTLQSLPSISLGFHLPWFSSSGLFFSSLHFSNTKGKVAKNINYVTKGGSYLHRLKLI